MRADLHIHSIFSDGLYSPDEICKIAKTRGLSLLSVTDHDTLNGLEEKRSAAKKYGLSYLSGWEISAYRGNEKIHILGYGCEKGEAYQAFTDARKSAALLRAQDSVEKFRALGVPLTLEQVLQMQPEPSSPIHTMHVARAAAKHLGLTDGQTYERYLAPGMAANSNIGRPTPEEGIDCIHALGGVAVVAHPGRMAMGFDEREKLLVGLAEYGVDGIEAVYTTHTEKEMEYFCGLAKRLGLFVTGGSDTHYEEETHRIGYPCFYASDALLTLAKKG